MTLVQKIPINKITPDKNQPRQRFNESELKELSENIKYQGVINPIEVDENYVIVTGERRWKAAKLAGLKEVPCIINNIHGKERFLRQVSENVHHNTMAPIDTAKAYRKLITIYKICKVCPGHSLDKGITWLHEQTGKARKQIGEILALLDQSLEFQKAVNRGDIYYTNIRALKSIPEKYRKQLEDKILTKDIGRRDVAYEIAYSVKENPDKADAILAKSYKGMTTQETRIYLNEFAPNEKVKASQALNKELDTGFNIAEAANKLIKTLKETPKEEVSKINQPLVFMALMTLFKTLKEYINDEEIKQLE